MKKLRGVCVGAGYFSQFHFDAWQRLPNVKITAICDFDQEKAASNCEKYGFGNAYTDASEMLQKEQPDFIDIITPPETHSALCKLAIDNGVHIVCQKPLAPNLTEAKEMVSLVAASNVRMMVHENFRFMPWYREIKKLLNSNVIGSQLHAIHLRMRMGDGWQEDAYMNRQPYFREMPQLLIYETGIHFIDVFRYLMGDIKEVYAKLRTLNSNIKGEDFAWIHFEFAKGIPGFLDANRYNENTADDPRLTFGAVLIEGNQGSLRLYDDGKITIKLLGEKEQLYDYHFEAINFAGDCVYNTQEHFINCLRNGTNFETDVASYLDNLIVQDKIYESAKKGFPIKV